MVILPIEESTKEFFYPSAVEKTGRNGPAIKQTLPDLFLVFLCRKECPERKW
jgi:hypothetical protein